MILFVNADLGLNMPNYTAAKNNFHFLYDTFKNHNCKNFIVQTFNPENYSIRNACKIDIDLFQKQDNKFRKDNNYPPFTDVCVLLYKNEIEERLFTKVDKLHKELLYLKDKYKMDDLEIYSTPPIIYKIFGKYRYNIVLK
jgi:primosomal protein N' (replication factor Y)